MNYARWETLYDLEKNDYINGVGLKDNINSSGLPIGYDDNKMYIDSRFNHSVVIGATGSGKTQTILLPMLKFSCMAKESALVHDANFEIYDLTHKMFEENGYNVVKLNFDECIKTNFFNPFDIVIKYYKEKNFDKAQDIIDYIAYYLLNEKDESNSDPFWINSAINYFKGMCLYLLSKDKKLNLMEIYDLHEYIKKNSDEFIKDMDKHSPMYINLSGILSAPKETRESIFSVFSQKFNIYISKENLTKMLLESNFNLFNINKNKTIIYVKSGNSNVFKNIFPLLVNEIYDIKNTKDRFNILIDDFGELNPFKDFVRLLNYSRNIGIIFTIFIKGFNELNNVYKSEEAEIIKLSIPTYVYLISQDIQTLEEISKMCGNKSDTAALISIEQLKTLKIFEAIILTTRSMPFKTKLLPYYEFNK